MLVVMFPSNLPLGRLPTYANRREADANLKTIENPVKSGKGKGKEKVTVDRVAKSNAINGKEIAGSSMDLMSGHPLTKDTSFEELPEGYMGKMLVYRSGAVKLKLGEVVYDVSHLYPASYFHNSLIPFLLEFKFLAIIFHDNGKKLI